jgi:hypothetical protein
MNDQEKYALYKQAKQTGGPCQVCNWHDGDGVRTCFYSSELGVVTHQNSEKGIMAGMTDSQKHLYQLRQKLVYINAELREKKLQLAAYDHHLYLEHMLAIAPDRYPVHDEYGNPLMPEEKNARYRASQMQEPLATDPAFSGWYQAHWWIPIERQGYYGSIPEELRGLIQHSKWGDSTAYMTHVYEPHCCGKGHKTEPEPYVIACTGCETEIKLWEHGVDYDMG